MFEKQTDTSYEVDALIKRRWSGVAFDPDKTIDDDALGSMLEAARWAPSCFGEQPWRFIVCRKSSHPEAWNKVFASLLDLNKKWCINVPVFLVVCCKTHFSHNGQSNPYAAYDSGAASLSICLEAAKMNIMTHQMAGFNPQSLNSEFAIPEGFNATAVMAAGYQLPKDKIPEQFEEKEFAPRKRKSLDAIHSYGVWGNMD